MKKADAGKAVLKEALKPPVPKTGPERFFYDKSSYTGTATAGPR